MLDPNDPAVRAAVFGKQVEDFLSSDIGQYLVERCRAEVLEAQDQLSRVFPYRRRKIQELQNRIRLAESFRDWLAEAYQSGINAQHALEDDYD